MGLPFNFPSNIMADETTPPETQVTSGRGHTVKRIIGGKEYEIPWGFKDFRTEGKAAKAVGIAYPGTSKKEE